MPKLEYTPGKGLVQKSGSGVDIKSGGPLTLEGDMSGLRRARKSVSAVGALTVADSGKIITLTGSAFILSLPPVATSAGVTYSVVAGAAANYSIQEDSGDNNVLTMVSVNASATERDHAFTKAQLSAGAIGDRFEIYCNGTFWIIFAAANAAVTAT
tara:strand:- start:60 stop:527 length:468 start_codon:yes stop_codon:yes gene_type:complete